MIYDSAGGCVDQRFSVLANYFGLCSGFDIEMRSVFVCSCIDDRISMHCDSSQAVLTINNTNSTDTGCYSIQLDNIYGTERMYSSVTIEGTSSCPAFYTHS